MLNEGAGSELFMVIEQRHPQIRTLLKTHQWTCQVGVYDHTGRTLLLALVTVGDGSQSADWWKN